MRKPNYYLLILIWVCTINLCSAQQKGSDLLSTLPSDSTLSALHDLPTKYYSKVDKKITTLDAQLTKKTLKYLRKFRRQEEKLQKKLQQVNPNTATTKADARYNNLTQKIKSKTGNIGKAFSGLYNPYLDTLGTSLSFLKQIKDVGSKANGPMKSFNDLENKLQLSEQVKAFISERKNQIKELLSRFTNLPGPLQNQYLKISKTEYYYSAQVLEYKDMLKDRDKIERKALGLLNKIPAFQKFIQKNSQLAQLFPMPGNMQAGTNPLASLSGLQTRSSVQALIQQRISLGGPNAQAQLQANLASAQSELSKIKDKLNQVGGNGGNIEMPDFKPNTQKTKPFLKRLEYITNLQFDKSPRYLPSSANIAFGVGYKLNKGSAGVAMGFKIGMGTIQHISFTSQGIGIRSYFDWKIKNQIYASGGYELNYNSSFKNIEQLKNYNAWQQSGLIGLSKQYKISKKVQGKMQFLYDFLANTHIPVSQPILFRIGYKF